MNQTKKMEISIQFIFTYLPHVDDRSTETVNLHSLSHLETGLDASYCSYNPLTQTPIMLKMPVRGLFTRTENFTVQSRDISWNFTKCHTSTQKIKQQKPCRMQSKSTFMYPKFHFAILLNRPILLATIVFLFPFFFFLNKEKANLRKNFFPNFLW